MLKISKEALNHLEKDYPGIGETILFFEEATFPSCHHCESESTAKVQCGIVGRTINLASATTKVKLIANGPKPGKYFCTVCSKYFD